MQVASFVILVGVLVVVHELGHFVLAKLFGLRVLRFSLGFGPRLIGFRFGETEYQISLVPIGGYVRIFGELPEDAAGTDDPRSFHTLAAWKQSLVILAGPIMNLALPLALYFVVGLGNDVAAPPVVGMIAKNEAADGVLLPGDRILEVNDEPIESKWELESAIDLARDNPTRLLIEREGERRLVSLTPRKHIDEVTQQETFRIGVAPAFPLASIGVRASNTPAAVAGLRSFDVIVSAGGAAIRGMRELEQILGKNRGSLLTVGYLRPVQVKGALGRLALLDIYEPHVTTLVPNRGKEDGLSRAGIEWSDLYVSRVLRNSSEHQAGIRPGDRINELDGEPVRGWAELLSKLRKGQGRTHALVWEREGHLLRGQLQLAHQAGTTSQGESYDRYFVAMDHWAPLGSEPPIATPHRWRYAAALAIESTLRDIQLTGRMFVQLLRGQLSLDALGGPLLVFEVAGRAAEQGALNYLSVMAFLSVNLGLVNLLPIPMLDGGHLATLGIETVRGRPLEPRTKRYASLVGFVLLVALMVIAFVNDISRSWPSFLERLNG